MYASNNLTMRAVERRDCEPLRVAHNASLEYLSDPTFVTESMQEAWFASLGGGASRRYVIDSEAGLTAFVRIDNRDTVNRTACIGLDIMPNLRRQGWGAKCFALLLRYCFSELNTNMVWLWTAAFNTAARKLYLKMGMEQVGRLPEGLYRGGAYHELLLMCLTREQWLSQKSENEHGSG